MADDGEWLAPLATAALREGEALRLRIGPLGAVPLLAKTVSLEVGEPLKRDEVTVVPLTWKATATPGLFPVMWADLEVVALDAELTQLTLRGRYEPPLGAVGRRLDRLLLHRIAEASVRSFLDRLVATLTSTEAAETAALS
ncbi:MAG: hypothetical protein WAL77_14280 [Candidatus Dormiibacterota bacterium]